MGGLKFFELAIFLVVIIKCGDAVSSFTFPNSEVSLEFVPKSDGVEYNIVRGDNVLQTITLDSTYKNMNFRPTPEGIRLIGTGGRELQFITLEDGPNLTLYRVSHLLTRNETRCDCMKLDIGRVSWYGGSERWWHFWPVEKSSFTNYSYVTKEEDSCAIAERYWLNSRGVFVYVDQSTPLFIDQNTDEYPNQLCFTAHKTTPYDERDTDMSFSYQIGIAKNVREAHMAAVTKYLHKPTGIPDERMVRHPIWSTWARYKKDINDEVIHEFADEITAHSFMNSQLEIDDYWEVCYGSLTFDTTKFPNTTNLVKELNAKGYRVTLWVHPFVNKDCSPWYDEAKQKGYLVLDHSGNDSTTWWNPGESSFIDFTNPEAARWYSERLFKLRSETGIDSFKFDAGETSWAPENPVLFGAKSLSPNSLTRAFVQTVSQFGPMIEVRTGFGTQNLPVFVRMLDKDSVWGWNNGLRTLVTTLMQMNLAGYPFVLPDMIGGNGYREIPDKELFIRWLQANVFMPSLQFSYVPWQYDQETVNISWAMTKLHDDYTNLIMSRMRLATQTGEPVNLPLWWIDPEDVVAQQIHDQFMLGTTIIAAPVLNPGEVKRDIYLPVGQWEDGNTGAIHHGPKWIMNYDAPLSVLPFFIQITP